MTRYFFDLHDRTNIVEDEIGLNLSDLSEASDWATSLIANMAAHVGTVAEPHDPREIRVHTAAGPCLAKIAFRYVTM
jgi:hypothetical protein